MAQELPTELIQQLEALGSEFADAVKPLVDEQSIRDTQAQYLGKKGKVSALMKRMGKLAPPDRKSVGQVANKVKASIADAVAAKLDQLVQAARAADLARSVDVTLPGRPRPEGHAHILWQVRDETERIFAELGFEVAEGPQIETDFNNFEALAMPADHPARDEQDTFFISDSVVLRTHTSPVQVRTMLEREPPVKVIAPGVVYRRDDDPTHSPQFVQVEGLVVDEGIRFSDLKGVLLHWVRKLFQKELDIRFRPSYFPFVEPGAEMDVECAFCTAENSSTCRVCKGTRWLEIGGCGMVDPDVFGHVNYDSEKYTGFAFGFGIDRMAMLKHGISDIKYLYDGDVRFLEQF